MLLYPKIKYYLFLLFISVSTLLILLLPLDHSIAKQNSKSIKDWMQIPNKKIYIYLDQSGTIVNESNQRLSQVIAKALRHLLSKEGNFLHPSDSISIMTFGTELEEKPKINFLEFIEKFEKPKIGEAVTNLALVFEDIEYKLDSYPVSGANNVRVFVIASDFINDPENKLNDTNKKQEAIDKAITAIENLTKKHGKKFSRSDTSDFIVLLRAPMPAVEEWRKGIYKEISNTIIPFLNTKLNARVLDCEGIDPTILVNHILQAIVKWVEINIDSFSQYQDNSYLGNLEVYNPNFIDVVLKGLNIQTDRDSDSYDRQLSNPFVIPARQKCHYDFNTRNWRIGYNLEYFILRPIQEPIPFVGNQFRLPLKFEIPGQIEISKTLSRRFGGAKPAILVKTNIKIESKRTNDAKIQFKLVRPDNQKIGKEIDSKIANVELIKGQAEKTVTFRFENIDIQQEYILYASEKLKEIEVISNKVTLSSKPLTKHTVRLMIIYTILLIFVFSLKRPEGIGNFFIPKTFWDLTHLLFLTQIFFDFACQVTSLISIEKIYWIFPSIGGSLSVSIFIFWRSSRKWAEDLNDQYSNNPDIGIKRWSNVYFLKRIVLAIICGLFVFLGIYNFVYFK